VGVGPGAQTALLEYIASETGGQFFESPDTDRLQTIYSQISKILNNQYILTYSSAGTGADVDTIVTLLYATASGATISQVSNALTYSSCP
jgi:phosphoribosylformylglycinamidine (FGAM) synthase-like enzyme